MARDHSRATPNEETNAQLPKRHSPRSRDFHAAERRSIAHAEPLIGQASIIDGDTLEIHGTRIRLFGIDAPESDQLCRSEGSEWCRCGQKTSNVLFDFIARRPVECVEVDRDRYQRAVAVCSVAGVDIADWLVGNGLALDWPRYSTAKATTPKPR